jgi:hypothetical protein
VEAWNKWREENPTIQPDLNGADLSVADLSEARLYRAYLRRAHLSRAHLSRAILNGVDLSGANLSGADLGEARVAGTVFVKVDLSAVNGLETVRHLAPSTIGVDTLYLSKGKIPQAFLRGCGVPETMITYIASLVGQPIQYYSCFISYSSQGQECAERLHADLQRRPVLVCAGRHEDGRQDTRPD